MVLAVLHLFPAQQSGGLIVAYGINKRDMEFMLKEVLDCDKLLATERYAGITWEDFDLMFANALRFSEERIRPINKLLDTHGAVYDPSTASVTLHEDHKKVYQEYIASGWIASTADPEWGGHGLPFSFHALFTEAFCFGSSAFMIMADITRGAGHLVHGHASDEIKKIYLKNMISGEWGGTMCLTEPQAGSAVGDIRTRAVRDGDSFLITGSKCFISCGEHDASPNIIHLVLARIEGAPDGIKGISLFVVPKFIPDEKGNPGEFNDVICGGAEHKLGNRGAPACVMNFGENGKCRGWLIGEENKGINAMFSMMNEERWGVGLQGMTIGSAAYAEALDYARTRMQGVDVTRMKDPAAPRVAIVEHPDVRRMLMTMKAQTEAMRALIYYTIYFNDIKKSSTDPKEQEKAQDRLDLLTPICKAHCSDTGFRVAEMAMQTLGGYGYSCEYPVELYLRDVKLTSIYEGTNGIQALDFVGRKLAAKGGMLLLGFVMDINKFIAANKGNEALAPQFTILEQARDKIAAIVASMPKKGRENPRYPLLHASSFLTAFAEFVCAYLMLEQSVVAHRKLGDIFDKTGADGDMAKRALIEENEEAAFYHNKIQTAAFYVTNILPDIFAREYAFSTGDTSALDVIF